MTTYQTIFTDYGRNAVAYAEATPGAQLNFTQMSVGDGAGSAVILDAGQTQLAREMFRANVNATYRDPNNAGQYIVELVIPASVAGFTIREVGLYDVNTGLVAVANTPDAYKPHASEGAFSDVVVRLTLAIANADVVTIVVDPNIAVATRTWVTNNITIGTLVPGGTYHQVLRKKGNADGDAEWAAPDTSAIIIDTIEEKQTLSEGQTTVDLVKCTTRGLAIYSAGSRISSDLWVQDPSVITRLHFLAPLPAGTEIICAQNEPTAHVPTPLEASLNLSDLTDVPAARTHLDVYSRAETDNATPAGSVIMYAGVGSLPGWIKCNGAALNRVAFARLFSAIGTRYGAGNNVDTFNVPDMRGMFVRGLDEGRGIDPNRTLGSEQSDAIKTHQHVFGSDDQVSPFGGYEAAMAGFPYDARSNYGGNGQNLRTKSDPAYPMASETRPRNIAMPYLIKF